MEFYSKMLPHYISRVMWNGAKPLAHLKLIFSEHCSPNMLKMDGGSQLRSFLFTEFATAWMLDHVMSSSNNPCLNRFNETTIKTVKGLLTPKVNTRDMTHTWLCWTTTACHSMASSHSHQKCCIADCCEQHFPNMLPHSQHHVWDVIAA